MLTPHNGAYGDQSLVGGSVNAFGRGVSGESEPFRTASVSNNDSGLNLSAQQFNAQVGPYRNSSVLQATGRNPGNLGYGTSDVSRRLPTGQYLGSVNGTSADSWSRATMLRLSAGQNTGIE